MSLSHPSPQASEIYEEDYKIQEVKDEIKKKTLQCFLDTTGLDAQSHRNFDCTYKTCPSSNQEHPSTEKEKRA